MTWWRARPRRWGSSGGDPPSRSALWRVFFRAARSAALKKKATAPGGAPSPRESRQGNSGSYRAGPGAVRCHAFASGYPRARITRANGPARALTRKVYGATGITNTSPSASNWIHLAGHVLTAWRGLWPHLELPCEILLFNLVSESSRCGCGKWKTNSCSPDETRLVGGRRRRAGVRVCGPATASVVRSCNIWK